MHESKQAKKKSASYCTMCASKCSEKRQLTPRSFPNRCPIVDVLFTSELLGCAWCLVGQHYVYNWKNVSAELGQSSSGGLSGSRTLLPNI